MDGIDPHRHLHRHGHAFGSSDRDRSPSGEGIEVLPLVVLSRTFPARPSWIPAIREFVRDCLAESPLTLDETRQVDETVSRALLDAAGPAGAIQVVFRIFPDHAEVDVLRSTSEETPGEPAPRSTMPDGPARPQPSASFAQWMSDVLEHEGLSQEAAAKQLGVSVKTVGRWLGGATEPRLRDLRRIREQFGRTPLEP